MASAARRLIVSPTSCHFPGLVTPSTSTFDISTTPDHATSCGLLPGAVSRYPLATGRTTCSVGQNQALGSVPRIIFGSNSDWPGLGLHGSKPPSQEPSLLSTAKPLCSPDRAGEFNDRHSSQYQNRVENAPKMRPRETGIVPLKQAGREVKPMAQ